MAKTARLNKKLKFIIERALDTKADKLILLDVSKASGLCDYFVIASGASSRQNKAIADNICDGLKQNDMPVKHIEGYDEGEWILLDCGSTIVHIFSQRLREFYNLEHFWKKAKKIPLP